MLQCMGDVGKVANGKLVINKTDLGLTKAKLNKLLKMLPLLGFVIDDNGDALTVWSAKHLQMCPAWKLLSTTAGDDIHIFMRTVFNPATDDITEVFYKYSDVEQPLRDFVKSLLAVGFKPQVSYGDVQGDMAGIKYVREHLEAGVKTTKQVKDETIRLVFSCMYQFRYHPQISYDFMSGKNPFIYLHKCFNTLPPAVQAVVYKFSGHCGGCGSCIVGDKSKVQAFCFTPAKYKGEDIKLCHTYKNMDTLTGYFRKPVYSPDEEFLSSVLEMYEVFANNLPVV